MQNQQLIDLACQVCGQAFAGRPSRKTCSRSCAVKLSWRNPATKAARSASIAENKRRPEALAITAALNANRWSRPGEREKLAEQNRREWADPVKGPRRAAAIAKTWADNPDIGERLSQIKKAQWQDPDYRRKMIEALRASHGSPEYRAKFSRALRERWQDPVLRVKYLRAVRRTVRRINSDPELRAANTERMKTLWADTAFRERMTRWMKEPGRLAAAATKRLNTIRTSGKQAKVFAADLETLRPRLTNFAYKLTRDGDAALDLVQSTMLKAIEHRSQFKAGTNLSAWVTTIMRNAFFTTKRRRREEEWNDVREDARADESAERQESAAELSDALSILRGLSDEFRVALMLIANGLSYAEVAEKLGLEEGTVKSRVHRARQALLQRMPDPSRRAAVGSAYEEAMEEFASVMAG